MMKRKRTSLLPRKPRLFASIADCMPHHVAHVRSSVAQSNGGTEQWRHRAMADPMRQSPADMHMRNAAYLPTVNCM